MNATTTTTTTNEPTLNEQNDEMDHAKESLENVENAAAKLTREVATVVDALKNRASDSALATRDHSEIVLQASLEVKEGVKMVEQASMEALLQASEMRKHFGELSKLAKIAEKVRRDLFHLEIEATRLRDKAVKRMSRAASAKSARSIRRNEIEDVELQPVVKRVNAKEGSSVAAVQEEERE